MIHLTISLVATHVSIFVRLFLLYRLANVPIINLLMQKIEPARESRVLTNQRSLNFCLYVRGHPLALFMCDRVAWAMLGLSKGADLPRSPLYCLFLKKSDPFTGWLK